MIWIIIIAVILLIVLAVNIPVTAYIRYHDGEADVKVSFLFKQLYPHVEKKKRQKRKQSLLQRRYPLMSLMLPKNPLLQPMRISRRTPLGKIQPQRKILR